MDKPQMKRTQEKFLRIMKYWRVRYQQATGRDRQSIGMLAAMLLVYAWWWSIVGF